MYFDWVINGRIVIQCRKVRQALLINVYKRVATPNQISLRIRIGHSSYTYLQHATPKQLTHIKTIRWRVIELYRHLGL